MKIEPQLKIAISYTDDLETISYILSEVLEGVYIRNYINFDGATGCTLVEEFTNYNMGKVYLLSITYENECSLFSMSLDDAEDVQSLIDEMIANEKNLHLLRQDYEQSK